LKKHLFLNLVTISLLVITVSCGQNSSTINYGTVGMSGDSLANATEKMHAYVDSGKLSGISTLVMKDGQLVYRDMYGFADIENQIPVDKGTIFRIFSMTKPVTAVALMTLYEEGRFKLDDPVSDYIPEFKGALVFTPGESSFTLEPQENEMTIRHLLTHTSGIPYGWDQNAYVDSLYRVHDVSGWDSATIGDKIKLLAGLPLKSQPGTRWEYGLSIDVAGYLVEVFSGIPFDQYLKTRVFDPLKMDDTGFSVPEEKHERLSTLYYKQGNADLTEASEFGDRFKEPATVFSGGGGLVSTMGDYLNFCSMMLNGGELNGERVLQESTVKLIMSDQLPKNAFYRGSGYGLAGAVNLESGEYSWAGMASTNFWINPENKMIIITMTQLLPSDHSYAHLFKELVMGAVL